MCTEYQDEDMERDEVDEAVDVDVVDEEMEEDEVPQNVQRHHEVAERRKCGNQEEEVEVVDPLTISVCKRCDLKKSRVFTREENVETKTIAKGELLVELASTLKDLREEEKVDFKGELIISFM